MALHWGGMLDNVADEKLIYLTGEVTKFLKICTTVSDDEHESWQISPIDLSNKLTDFKEMENSERNKILSELGERHFGRIRYIPEEIKQLNYIAFYREDDD